MRRKNMELIGPHAELLTSDVRSADACKRKAVAPRVLLDAESLLSSRRERLQ